MNIGGIPVPIPMSIGGVIGLLIDALITFAIIMIANKVISHEMEAKHALIMAIAAYFITPIAMFLVISMLPGMVSLVFLGFLIPLIIWVVLGEILLKGEMKEKLMVAVIAFVIYFVLTYVGIPGMIASMIPI